MKSILDFDLDPMTNLILHVVAQACDDYRYGNGKEKADAKAFLLSAYGQMFLNSVPTSRLVSLLDR